MKRLHFVGLWDPESEDRAVFHRRALEEIVQYEEQVEAWHRTGKPPAGLRVMGDVVMRLDRTQYPDQGGLWVPATLIDELYVDLTRPPVGEEDKAIMRDISQWERQRVATATAASKDRADTRWKRDALRGWLSDPSNGRIIESMCARAWRRCSEEKWATVESEDGIKQWEIAEMKKEHKAGECGCPKPE